VHDERRQEIGEKIGERMEKRKSIKRCLFSGKGRKGRKNISSVHHFPTKFTKSGNRKRGGERESLPSKISGSHLDKERIEDGLFRMIPKKLIVGK